MSYVIEQVDWCDEKWWGVCEGTVVWDCFQTRAEAKADVMRRLAEDADDELLRLVIELAEAADYHFHPVTTHAWRCDWCNRRPTRRVVYRRNKTINGVEQPMIKVGGICDGCNPMTSPREGSR